MALARTRFTAMPEEIAESEDTITNGGIAVGDLDNKILP
jgi:hypothetical protein